MAKGFSNKSARLTSAAGTTNSTLVSSVPCDLYCIIATNTSAAVKFIKFYNKAAAPTVGTDTPFLTIAIPAGGLINVQIEQGLYFNLGLGFALTGADGDSDTTALTAGDIKGLNIVYFS